jgi:histidinol-phosphate aminotransferase
VEARLTFFRSSIADLVPYEPGKPVEEVRRELGLDRVVKLASNEGPFPPLPAALEALQRELLELNRYPDGGAWELRSTLAQRHAVAFEEVLTGPGADGIVDFLSQASLEPGDEVVCGWPSFPSYVLMAKKLGAVARTVPLRDHTYDLDGLLAAIGPRTKLVYVCHPNNPTGTANGRAELVSFLDRLPDHVLCVLDQAYFEYIDDPDYADGIELFREGRRLVVLRTFSKIYGLAGLRVAGGSRRPTSSPPRARCGARSRSRRSRRWRRSRASTTRRSSRGGAPSTPRGASSWPTCSARTASSRRGRRTGTSSSPRSATAARCSSVCWARG